MRNEKRKKGATVNVKVRTEPQSEYLRRHSTVKSTNQKSKIKNQSRRTLEVFVHHVSSTQWTSRHPKTLLGYSTEGYL